MHRAGSNGAGSVICRNRREVRPNLDYSMVLGQT